MNWLLLKATRSSLATPISVTGKADYEYRKVVRGIRSNKKKVDLKTIIRDEQWDIITLQQASHYSGLPKTYGNLAQFKRLVQS